MNSTILRVTWRKAVQAGYQGNVYAKTRWTTNIEKFAFFWKVIVLKRISSTMPPKKKGKAKKGGGNDGDEERAESKPTEREILLSQQWVPMPIHCKPIKALRFSPIHMYTNFVILQMFRARSAKGMKKLFELESRLILKHSSNT